jgi:hypothetical protein
VSKVSDASKLLFWFVSISGVGSFRVEVRVRCECGAESCMGDTG